MEGGVSRITSLDFVRGLGIFGMTLVHGLFNAVELNYLLTFDRWYKYILAIFIGPILIFAPFRGTFAIISGTAYSFLTGQTIIARRDGKKRFWTWYLIGILKSVLSFFILWLLSIVYLYSIELWQVSIPQSRPVIYEPTWKIATIYASPLSYFSISSVLDAIIFPPIFYAFLILFTKLYPATVPLPHSITRVTSANFLHADAPSTPASVRGSVNLSLARMQPFTFNLDRATAAVPEQTQSTTDPERMGVADQMSDQEGTGGEGEANNRTDQTNLIENLTVPVHAPPIVPTYSSTGHMVTAIATAWILFLLSYCIILPTNAVVSALAKPLNLSPAEFCYLPNGYQGKDIASQMEYMKAYFLIAFGANYYPLFPYYGATLLGFSLGLCLLAAYYNKKEYSQAHDEAVKRSQQVIPITTQSQKLLYSHKVQAQLGGASPARSSSLAKEGKRYSDFPTANPRFVRTIYGIMSIFAGGMFLSGVISTAIKGSFFRGIDGSLDLSGYCMPREEGMAVFGLSMFIIILFIAIFEGGTVRQCCVNIQRVSYILRFSTVSLTIFTCQIWIDLMGKFILSRYFPDILRGKEERFFVILLIIPMTILTYWVFTTISDSINNMWTLDWVVSRIGGIIMGRYGKQRPLVDYHRRIRPMCLLARAPKKEADYEKVPIYNPA